MLTNFEKNNNAFIILQCCAIVVPWSEITYEMIRCMVIERNQDHQYLMPMFIYYVCIVGSKKQAKKNIEKMKRSEFKKNKMST
jgi:hypothetical protein